MDLFTEAQKAALKDGADALRYRAERLRHHSEYEFDKHEEKAREFSMNAAILDELATAAM